jgi:hypothetical protein
MRLKDARAAGDFSVEPQHPLLIQRPAPGDPLSARILGPDSERTQSELGEHFSNERSVSDRTRHDNKVTLRMLVEAIGDDLPVYRLTRQHVHAFKRMLSESPANYVKRFPGMTLPEAVQTNKRRATPYPLMDARTVNDKYLARLHAFLNWAVGSDIIPDNPSAGIKVEQPPRSQPPRVNFDSHDLSLLFGSHFPAQNRWLERTRMGHAAFVVRRVPCKRTCPGAPCQRAV